jgi:hypothetical protein
MTFQYPPRRERIRVVGWAACGRKLERRLIRVAARAVELAAVELPGACVAVSAGARQMRQAAQCQYLDLVPTDPAPFLSTIILASAGLVAIIGGLLVARFVGLDSDERSNRRVLGDAAGRLASARRRATEARNSLVAFEARDFLKGRGVLSVIGQGISDLEALRMLDDCPLSDEELRPFVAEVAEEFTRARQALPPRVSAASADDWEHFRRMTPDLPEIRWPRVWEKIFDEIRNEVAKAEAARRRAAARLSGNLLAGLLDPSAFTPPPVRVIDQSGTGARRYDELVAADQRAQQRVEDYEDELRRLEEAHKDIVRPDSRLWWGVASS